MIATVVGAALFAFGLWMGVNANTGPQSTMGSALLLIGAIALITGIATMVV